jgi:hypothetical protein
MMMIGCQLMHDRKDDDDEDSEASHAILKRVLAIGQMPPDQWPRLLAAIIDELPRGGPPDDDDDPR